MRLIFLLCLLLALTSCFPKHSDPAITIYSTMDQAMAAARSTGGLVFVVAPTGSMEPLLHGGDLVAVKRGWPTDPSTLIGKVITYRATWLPSNSPPVTHRVVGYDAYGLLCEGDAVDAKHPENRYRVGRAEYVGEVVGIYRVKL